MVCSFPTDSRQAIAAPSSLWPRISKRRGGTRCGGLPSDLHCRWCDPLRVLAFAAAYTTRLGIGLCGVPRPASQPALLVRQLMTVNALAAGRLHLGLDAGWSREEWTAFVARMQAAQAGDRRSLARDEPPCAQRSRPGIAQTGRMLDAVAQHAFADGWIVTDVSTTMLEALERFLASVHRDLRAVPVSVRLAVRETQRRVRGDRALGTGCQDQLLDDLQRLSRIGVHQVILDLTGGTPWCSWLPWTTDVLRADAQTVLW